MSANFPSIPLIGTETSKSQPGCQLIVRKRGDRGTWALGDGYILKYRPYHPGCGIEILNLDFVKRSLGTTKSMPLTPQIDLRWRQGDRFFTIERRIGGESLNNALPRFKQQDVARISRQVGRYIIDLKTITLPHAARLDGRPVNDQRLFKPLPEPSSINYSVCATDSDLASNLALSITHRLDKSSIDAFMADMPSGLPFTFSHSNINKGNIIIQDGNFAGLIDWKLAGFYPSWWEYVNTLPSLRKYFPAQIQDHCALEWFCVYRVIRDKTKEEGASKLSEYLGRSV